MTDAIKIVIENLSSTDTRYELVMKSIVSYIEQDIESKEAEIKDLEKDDNYWLNRFFFEGAIYADRKIIEKLNNCY